MTQSQGWLECILIRRFSNNGGRPTSKKTCILLRYSGVCGMNMISKIFKATATLEGAVGCL